MLHQFGYNFYLLGWKSLFFWTFYRPTLYYICQSGSNAAISKAGFNNRC